MMWGHGWGPGRALFGLLHVLWWVLLILAIVVLIRWSSSRGARGAPPPEGDLAVAILRER